MSRYIYNPNDGELYHFGVKGMKWGVRRARYNVSKGSNGNTKGQNSKKQLTPEQKASKRKKALKVGAAVVGTALAVYGAKKLNDYVRDKNTAIRMEQGKKLVDGFFKETRSRRIRAEEAGGRMWEIRQETDRDMIKAIMDEQRYKARNDSFARAAKNVYDDYRRNRRK